MDRSIYNPPVRWRPRYRFRLQTLFVLIAQLALVIFGAKLAWRGWQFLSKAHEHERKAKQTMRFGPGVAESTSREWEAWRKYHADMAMKYRQASEYPIFTVEPDPPEPPRPTNH